MDSENVVIGFCKFEGARVIDIETSELGWLKRYVRLADSEWFAIQVEIRRRREYSRRTRRRHRTRWTASSQAMIRAVA
jgi:hypothetical protein